MKDKPNHPEKNLIDNTTNTESKYPLLDGHRWLLGYEGRYAGCFEGHIWSYLGRYPKGKQKNRYLTVCLSKDGRRKTCSVHQLICAAFHGPKPANAQCVAHFDDDKFNNRPDNLRYTVMGKTSDAKDLLEGKVDPAFYTRGSNQFDKVFNQSPKTRRADASEIREYLKRHPIDCECQFCR